MYAIFKNGGKQYKVREGQKIRLEKLDSAIGDTVTFHDILMIATDKDLKIGNPIILSGQIKGTIINHGRKEKIKIIKFRRRKHFRKHQGHRQWFTEVKISNIIF